MGRLTAEQLQSIVSRHSSPASTLIETGTYHGDFTTIASTIFKSVYGIELDDYNFGITKESCSEYKNIKIIHGSSTDVLPQLTLNEPVVFYLDAHYFSPSGSVDPGCANKSEFPLWKEIEFIKARQYKDIVIVDDVHTFGAVREELRFKPGDKEWESVSTDWLVNLLGRVIDSEIIGDAFIMWRD